MFRFSQTLTHNGISNRFSGFKATPQSKPQEKKSFILGKYKDRLFVRTPEMDASDDDQGNHIPVGVLCLLIRLPLVPISGVPQSLLAAVQSRDLHRFLEFFLQSKRDFSKVACWSRVVRVDATF